MKERHNGDPSAHVSWPSLIVLNSPQGSDGNSIFRHNVDDKIRNSSTLESQSHQSRPTELRELGSRPPTLVTYAPLPAGEGQARRKTTGEEQEPELEVREEHRGRGEEHVNWQQENKEVNSGAIGTEQV
ncbi:hypothetical protein QQF64_000547 [Cirrhinus molitorella]|uniref:Prolactin receptor n=1 Tax=Cirrhinus molitorella TaxID=172907 RepID=A0ABR3NXG8_9TELE